MTFYLWLSDIQVCHSQCFLNTFPRLLGVAHRMTLLSCYKTVDLWKHPFPKARPTSGLLAKKQARRERGVKREVEALQNQACFLILAYPSPVGVGQSTLSKHCGRSTRQEEEHLLWLCTGPWRSAQPEVEQEYYSLPQQRAEGVWKTQRSRFQVSQPNC